MTPIWGNTFLFRSSQQLPRLRLGPSKGFLSWHGALLGPSPRALLAELQRYKDTIRSAPGHRQKQLTQTLVKSLKNILFTPIISLLVKRGKNWIEVSDQTCCSHTGVPEGCPWSFERPLRWQAPWRSPFSNAQVGSSVWIHLHKDRKKSTIINWCFEFDNVL